MFKLHGMPKSIINGRDNKFTNVFWKELFKLVGIRMDLNIIYHPQSDGKTKRVNQRIEGKIRNYVTGQ